MIPSFEVYTPTTEAVSAAGAISSDFSSAAALSVSVVSSFVSAAVVASVVPSAEVVSSAVVVTADDPETDEGSLFLASPQLQRADIKTDDIIAAVITDFFIFISFELQVHCGIAAFIIYIRNPKHIMDIKMKKFRRDDQLPFTSILNVPSALTL